MSGKKNLFKSEEVVEKDDDPWDDTLLVKAYERAINLTKMKIENEKQESNETGDPSSSSPIAPCEDSTNFSKAGNLSKKSKLMRNDLLKKSAAIGRKTINDNETLWKAGMHCRCTFSGDNQEYEAVILWIKWKKKIAKIRYIGFNNEENVTLSNLKPSHGDKARDEQLNKSDEISPPPPPPSISFVPLGTEEARNAMLMSWYMSGYHTGYYHGMKHAQIKFKRKGNNSRRFPYIFT